MNGRHLRRLVGRSGLALAVLAAAAGCSGGGPDEGEARLSIDDASSVRITEPGEEPRTITSDVTVRDGDLVEMLTGTAELNSPGDVVYELRATGGPATELVVGPVPELRAGSLLLREGLPARVSVDGREIAAEGKARVDHEVVAAYAGLIRIDDGDGGEVVELPALRQVALAGLDAGYRPIEYRGLDSWDRRYLAEAVAFGERLESIARGLTSQISVNAGRTEQFYERVLPALREEPDFTTDILDPDRPQGEILVGASIAVGGRSGTFLERWRAVFAFRDQGALWGIVALDQGVRREPVLDRLVENIDLAIGDTGGVPRSRDTGGAPDDPDRPGPTTTSTPVRPGPTSTTTTTRPTTPPTDPPGPLDPLDPVLDPLDPVLDPLDPVLGPLDPPVSGVDPVGGVLDPVLGPVGAPVTTVVQQVEQVLDGLLGGFGL